MHSLPSFPRATSLSVLGLLLCSAHVPAQTTLNQTTLNQGKRNSGEFPRACVFDAATSGKLPAGLSKTDWSSIRAAHESNRHAAFAVGDGYQARNPGQRWTIRFDGRGVSTKPDTGGWTWGLELERYGFAGEERDVCEPLRVSAHGDRVAYDWDATLQEWWVNEARGLEHGYTVRERPANGDDRPLTFTLAVRGDLQPRVQGDGRGVRFADADGVEVLAYVGLVVFDADGRSLVAHLEASRAELYLTIDEQSARYPLTIDPLALQAYLKASNTDALDLFGISVSVWSDTVVVGAQGEASSATGVNGSQSDNSAVSAGAAYVFVRSGTTWSQEAYLKASNTDAVDFFGHSVSISGDTVVVGASDESSNAIGVDGNQSNNMASSAGAVYVFVRSGTTWTQQAYLKASNTNGGDTFGETVSVSGDTVVVGAFHEDSNDTGVNGNEGDNSATNAGAAYVFVRSGTTWSQQAYLKASNTEAGDRFGYSVAVSGDTVVVGAYAEGSSATGVDGNQSDNSTSVAGAAYVFVRSGTTWSQQAYLKASNTDLGDGFGVRVSISSDTTVVSARGEDSNANGVNGNQGDNSVSDAGAAYVFVRSGTTWSQQAYLKASNSGESDGFGVSVSVSGETVVVGAGTEASNATGVNGDQANNAAGGSGAAYVFVRSGTSWSQQAYLKASNTEAGDQFGGAVSVSGDTVVVGAYTESSNATGVNGNESDNSAGHAGAAYVFVQSPSNAYCFGDAIDPIVTALCPCGNLGDAGHGCANSFSSAGGSLTAAGTTSPNTILFAATELPNNSLTVGFRTPANAVPGGAVFGDGVRCQSGTLIRFGAHNSGTAGDVTNTWTSTTATLGSGLTRYYQVQYRNSSPSFCPPETFNITNGYVLVW